MFSSVNTAFEVAVIRPGEGPGLGVDEKRGGMARQMLEEIRTDVPGHLHEGEASGNTGDAPEDVVGGDQGAQNPDGHDHAVRCGAGGKGVDEGLESILRADGAG